MRGQRVEREAGAGSCLPQGSFGATHGRDINQLSDNSLDIRLPTRAMRSRPVLGTEKWTRRRQQASVSACEGAHERAAMRQRRLSSRR
jgi:hypothetical protein